jgi:hypothetical protein
MPAARRDLSDLRRRLGAATRAAERGAADEREVRILGLEFLKECIPPALKTPNEDLRRLAQQMGEMFARFMGGPQAQFDNEGRDLVFEFLRLFGKPAGFDFEGLRNKLREVVADNPVDVLEDGCYHRHVLAVELLAYLSEPVFGAPVEP